MNENKHTPGPWAITPSTASRGEFYVLQPAPRADLQPKHIARIVGWGADYQQCPEMKANARLIAAAPDLLAALGVIANRTANSGDMIGETVRETGAIALAAIEKATR